MSPSHNAATERRHFHPARHPGYAGHSVERWRGTLGRDGLGPERQIAVIPVNRVATEVQLIPRDSIDFRDAVLEGERLGLDYEYNIMRGTPYVMRRRILRAPSGAPLQSASVWFAVGCLACLG